MPIPEYLEDSRERIQNLPAQNLGCWSSAYEHPVFYQFPALVQLRERFPTRIIHRNDIIDLLVQGERYLAFVAILVWGMHNATRPRIKGGGRNDSHFYYALNQPRDEIENILNSVENILVDGDSGLAFRSMLPGNENKIEGIGVSYFTKILFFIGQYNDQVLQKPLILDRWTTIAAYALISQRHPEYLRYYFTCVKSGTNNRPGTVLTRSGNHLVALYERFILLMGYWAHEIEVSEATLETFVFGYDLKQGLLNDNPRMQLWEIVDQNRNLI